MEKIMLIWLVGLVSVMLIVKVYEFTQMCIYYRAVSQARKKDRDYPDL